MPAVFPWASASPLVALAVVASLLVVTIGLVIARDRAKRLLARIERNDPHAPFFRRARFVRRTTKAVTWSLAVGGVYAFLYGSTWVWAPLGPTLFVPFVAQAVPILIIIATLLVASLATEAARDIPDRAEQLARWRGGKANRQVARALELFLRYAIVAVAIILVGASALDILGFQGDVGAALLLWGRGQAGAIFLVLGLVGVGLVGGRVIRAIASEVRYTSTRVSPQVVDALGATFRGILYAILGIIGIFTLLQAIGLGSVGGTLVVVLSSFIGLAVAMAGTGSIGNALSGMVLLGFRPFEKGDRVVLLDDLICDIDDVTLMFTRVRTLAHELVDIPNNQVLLKRIRNLSRSGPHAIVVKLAIGYEASHALVRELAEAAASKSQGILKDPAPKLYAREFGNYAIEYELYAHTNEPRHLEARSELLGRLQESFYAAGVEIMTPDVMIMRAGKKAEEEGFVRVLVKAPLEKKEVNDNARG